MKRIELTQHTVRCPLEDRAASVTVRTDADGHPSSRHLDVAGCSLVSSASVAASARSAYLPDVAPPAHYLRDIDPGACRSEVACPKRCLAVLNAAEAGAVEIPCTSGIHDGLELARRVQTPAMMRVLWFYSA
jgi:hypothetical protein